jgi:hypothetical protein
MVVDDDDEVFNRFSASCSRREASGGPVSVCTGEITDDFD